MIDVSFDVYSDAGGRDPDQHSPTLRAYHKHLWSKPLPCGKVFLLQDDKPSHYLYHCSELGKFSLGSDAITHSYQNQTRKKWLTEQIPQAVQTLFDLGSTIGAYIIFPNRQINRKNTINQARGVSRMIDDRFDLTLECIRRFYLNQESPLTDVIDRYASFFALFGSFHAYVDFFLLNDLVNDDGSIRFYLPFDDFQSPATFACVDDYLLYKRNVKAFIMSRNERILQA